MGEQQPFFLLPGEGRRIGIGPGFTVQKASGADTLGRFGIFESHQPPRATGPELHYHREMVEMFWVLEGTMHIVAGDSEADAPAGSFALVPPGTVHRFNNPTDEPARMLIMFAPGGAREQYFEGLAAFRQRLERPSREELLELWHRFDQYLPEE